MTGKTLRKKQQKERTQNKQYLKIMGKNWCLTLSQLMLHICGVSKSSVNDTRKQTKQKIQIT
jgi:hypothetical protein